MRLSAILDATVLLATAASAAAIAHAMSAERPAGPSPRTRFLRHPFTQFLLVSALLFTNQILFNVYVRVVHHGDPSFVARYVPAGWFAVVPRDSLVVAVARGLGARAAWLSPTVLRVQAFLELPFVLFAYLSIARLLDRALYRALARSWLVVAASVAFTVPFCVAELSLPNPWTTDDLAVRAVACVLTPAWIAWCARDERGGVRFPDAESRPTGIVGLATFAAGAIATAYAVLVLYDVTLLYNLAHLDAHVGPLVAAIAIATLAHVGDGRYDGFAHRVWTGAYGAPPPAPLGVRIATSCLATFTALFFVPSLALRYAGNHPSALLFGIALVIGSAVLGAAHALRATRPRPVDVVAAAASAIVAAPVALLAAATDLAGLAAYEDPFPEHLLLRKAALFLVVAIVTWRLAESLFARLTETALRRACG